MLVEKVKLEGEEANRFLFVTGTLHERLSADEIVFRLCRRLRLAVKTFTPSSVSYAYHHDDEAWDIREGEFVSSSAFFKTEKRRRVFKIQRSDKPACFFLLADRHLLKEDLAMLARCLQYAEAELSDQ